MKVIELRDGAHKIYIGTKEELEATKKHWRVVGQAQWDDENENLFINKDYNGPGKENLEMISWICSDITLEIMEEIKKEIGD